MAEYSLDQQLISRRWSLDWPATIFLCASLLLSREATLRAEDGADAAAALHYNQVREQRGAALAGHRPWTWEIESTRAKVWIIGCLHLGAAHDAGAFPAYLPAYRMAAVLYFETVPGSWNSYETRQLIDQRGFLHDRQSLSSKVSKQTWQQVKAALGQRPSMLAAISTMEPWLAAFSLSQDAYNRTGLRAEDSLEAYYERLAINDRKPVGGLEAPKDQILAMADASPADQEEFLRETVSGQGSVAAQTQIIRDAWLSGDGARLQAALGVSASAVRSGLNESLIVARNRHWVRKIQEIADRGKNAMIIVGVEHLVTAADALPDLLARAGLPAHRADSHAVKTNTAPSLPAKSESSPIPYPYRGQTPQ
jgi:hypothetical protein